MATTRQKRRNIVVLKEPIIPGKNDQFFIPTLGTVSNNGFYYLGVGMREAARFFDVRLNAMSKRIKWNTLEYFLVNDRPFFPDYALAKKRYERSRRHREIVCYDCKIDNLGLELKTFFDQGAIEIVKRFGNVSISLQEVEVASIPSNWDKEKSRPREYLIFHDLLLEMNFDTNKKHYYAMIHTKNPKGWLIKGGRNAISLTEFRAMKKAFYEDRAKAVAQYFPGK